MAQLLPSTVKRFSYTSYNTITTNKSGGWGGEKGGCLT